MFKITLADILSYAVNNLTLWGSGMKTSFF